jgi:two-component system OmpR family response regulator
MKQLLIIAKDPTLPAAVATALQGMSCAMTCVGEAEAAFALLDSTPVALIFLDLEGLGSDGLHVLEVLRARNNPVPVFVAPSPREEMAPLREAAGRGVYYETMRAPLAHDEIRAATAAALAT